ncbi:MAG: META domain-containing protein [Acidobacteriaceae bacterium]|nr:META domain-containing protein [Acidobacteriaceae bacterium]
MFRVATRVATCYFLAWTAFVCWPQMALSWQGQFLTIKGSLTYRERIALTPDSLAIVELRDVAASPSTPVIAEQRIDLKGRQIPIPFELSVDRAKLASGKQYVIRGGILRSRGQIEWVSEEVAVDANATTVDVGTVPLTPFRPEPFKSELLCGSERISVSFPGNIARVTVGGQAYEMKPVQTASGSKLEAVDDPTTSLWSKGRNGILVVKGKTYPECVPVADLVSQTFRANGHEPGWQLEVTAGQLTLVTDYGATKTAVPAPKMETMPDGRRYTGSGEGRSVTVTVVDRLCRDIMTGIPKPNTVTVTLEGRTLKGCGGDPATLLQGNTWVVQTINGTAPVDPSRVTLSFGPDGRVLGTSFCNAYDGHYRITGEGLTIDAVASTRKACAAPLMKQEAAFLSILQNVLRFEIQPEGTLVLQTSDQHTMIARRENSGAR